MNKTQLTASMLAALRSYWRIRAGLATYRSANLGALPSEVVHYENIPEVGVATSLLANETLDETFGAIEAYASERLTRDTLMIILASFEEFLSWKLASISQSPEGTFGELQRRVEQHFSIPLHDIERVDEMRECRNCLVHHGGRVTARYLKAAAKVWSSSSGAIHDPATVAMLKVSPLYLAYVCDAAASYAGSLP